MTGKTLYQEFLKIERIFSFIGVMIGTNWTDLTKTEQYIWNELARRITWKKGSRRK